MVLLYPVTQAELTALMRNCGFPLLHGWGNRGYREPRLAASVCLASRQKGGSRTSSISHVQLAIKRRKAHALAPSRNKGTNSAVGGFCRARERPSRQGCGGRWDRWATRVRGPLHDEGSQTEIKQPARNVPVSSVAYTGLLKRGT